METKQVTIGNEIWHYRKNDERGIVLWYPDLNGEPNLLFPQTHPAAGQKADWMKKITIDGKTYYCETSDDEVIVYREHDGLPDFDAPQIISSAKLLESIAKARGLKKEKDLADYFHVTRNTLYKWKKQNPPGLVLKILVTDLENIYLYKKMQKAQKQICQNAKDLLL